MLKEKEPVDDWQDALGRKTQFVGILENICQALELTATQYETAKSRYETIGKYLTEADDIFLKKSAIYPQGSISLGTTVRPMGREEYDIDLVCIVPSMSPETPPETLKKIVGDRLKENERYKGILEEKLRCWRINYANEFHLDITPSIPNPSCRNEGELVPDKKLKEWKPSNPKGYRRSFEDCAKLQPRMSLFTASMSEARTNIEDLPAPTKFKGVLKRCVQICKRHRDLWFEGAEVAPISIIITTLAAKSYRHCVLNRLYDTEFDLLLDVIREMPQFIEMKKIGNRTMYFVWNDSTSGENFAEKWNEDVRLPRAFFAWQKEILGDLEEFLNQQGLDTLRNSLNASFGEDVVGKAFGSLTDTVSGLRTSHILSVSSSLGLVRPNTKTVPVRHNTFFGRNE